MRCMTGTLVACGSCTPMIMQGQISISQFLSHTLPQGLNPRVERLLLRLTELQVVPPLGAVP